jgi:hypothetical protein
MRKFQTAYCLLKKSCFELSRDGEDSSFQIFQVRTGRDVEPSCAVASKRSCDLILTRQFALSHLPKPAPQRRSFFIVKTVDTNVLFLNIEHGLHELFLCLFRPSSDVLQEYFKALLFHGWQCITVRQSAIASTRVRYAAFACPVIRC